ncbi:FAS1-like dehydratase domain-containing protein [Micrococcoides hystricis]|uniref:UPF0336 protein ACFFFR_04390 n=1 Tax=Micrococcoides hystricis TaxID=1572761 RepID=A0ABV6P910_9MICC
MSVNTDMAGRVYPPAPSYQIGREKIREFAAATQATNPAHFDVEAAQALGHADLLAPPTFAVIIAQQAEAALVKDPEAGIDFSRVVHADERFTYQRPLIAGMEVQATLSVERIRAMGTGAMVSTKVTLQDVSDDSLVAEVFSTLLVRGEDQ